MLDQKKEKKYLCRMISSSLNLPDTVIMQSVNQKLS